MALDRSQMDALARELDQVLRGLNSLTPPDDVRVTQALGACRQAMQQGYASRAIPVLQALRQHFPQRSDTAMLLGYALRMEQRYPEAEAIFSAAQDDFTNDPALAFGLAQTRFELGLPAAAAFRRAQQLMPGNADVVRNLAAALASEGDVAGAQAVLTPILDQQPEWLDGHKLLATLRWTAGDRLEFADSYAAACRARPGDQVLWLAWFSTMAQIRDWDASRAILHAAQNALGDTPALLAARFFMAVEAGDLPAAEALLKETAQISGDVTALSRIRLFIRNGRYDAAEAEALARTGGASAPMFWPYLSVIWRLTESEKANWLDRPDQFIRAMDLDLESGALAELATLLRSLHTAQAPYIEQSVRGGTQTDRSVLLRHERPLQAIRAQLLEAVHSYVADLPAPEPGHPLLEVPRTHLLIEGSWSVRLLRQGHNVPHTHPKGWLSSAFYVSLPDAADMGPPPAGHIAFGTPPVELATGLCAYRHVAPEPGRLVLFPSTMWHGTVPFADGERLVIAFDIRPPSY